jgi:hypothetical protein
MQVERDFVSITRRETEQVAVQQNSDYNLTQQDVTQQRMFA